MDKFFTANGPVPGVTNAMYKNLANLMGLTDPNEVARQINAGKWKLSLVAAAVASALLTTLNPVATIVPARTELFSDITSSLERFRQYDADNYNTWFSGTRESLCEAATLKTSSLARDAKVREICDHLGGEVLAEISEWQYQQFLLNADRSKWYLAFVKDDKGRLRAVGADWYGGGWCFSANALDFPDHWLASGVVVSRNLDTVQLRV